MALHNIRCSTPRFSSGSNIFSANSGPLTISITWIVFQYRMCYSFALWRTTFNQRPLSDCFERHIGGGRFRSPTAPTIIVSYISIQHNNYLWLSLFHNPFLLVASQGLYLKGKSSSAARITLGGRNSNHNRIIEIELGGIWLSCTQTWLSINQIPRKITTGWSLRSNSRNTKKIDAVTLIYTPRSYLF